MIVNMWEYIEKVQHLLKGDKIQYFNLFFSLFSEETPSTRLLQFRIEIGHFFSYTN